ncbi:hypothetical protein [Acidithiobacillus sulfurivorans]|uniref:Uncharacterized protein n=1 Tax=Acidithiobacillus sulfurivorans TaxID=1958756 RepID=A0ABS5ZYJ6_9PROT|nr:hypothetical protein [Acidithiobacillus sulfurivorans]MBU2760298.1 hypothetical protein [Acidithiobacillus sulfurivorans]
MKDPAYQIKNLKAFRGMEGNGFNAVLYLGTKRLGTIIDDASGGPLIYDMPEEDRKALYAYAQSLPDVVCPFNDPATGKPAVLPSNAFLFINDLIRQAMMKNGATGSKGA